MTAMTPLETVLAAIDAANAADPTLEPDGRPAALVYGERMSEELARRFPDASEHLRIAARGQHVERWKIARGDYPEGRAGYLAWRADEARAHGERVARREPEPELRDEVVEDAEQRLHEAPLRGEERRPVDALRHLRRRFVREGNGENGIGSNSPLLNKIGDAVRNDAGLPRSGSGQNQHGAINRFNPGPLLGIQLVE